MLTVNELFAGIGSQRAALERLGIEHKVVGIAEIDRFATLSYAAIYHDLDKKIKDYDFPSGIEMVDYLKEKNIGFDFKKNKPFSWERTVNKRTGKANKTLKQHYLASALSNNYGDIGKIDKLDYADFWTYSFPCQDISVAGKQAGIEHGKTRSGLLYEVERLLEKSKECGELPKYLMLENVKNLVGKKFKPQFEEWIERLDELGYNTKWQILNSKGYGIPQNRERVFAISIRKDIDTGYVFPEPFELKTRLKDILEDEVDEKFYLDNEKTRNLIRQLDYKPTNEIKLNQLGNFEKLANPSKQFNDPQTGRVLDAERICQALDTMQGGNRQPKILETNAIIKEFDIPKEILNDNERQRRVYNARGISPTVLARTDSSKIIEPKGIDKSINNPKIIEVANCITSREDRGISNRKAEGTAVLIPQATKKGYIECNVPGIADLSFPDSKTRRGRVQDNGEICPTLMAGQQDICYIDTPCIAASRGRNPNNPSDRTTGSPTEQRLEINQKGTSNTITTVQKDNYVLEPNVLTPKRTEYGKAIRKDYENGLISESRHNMTEMRPREDGISNTLTTVQKDNYVVEPELKFVGGIGDKDWAGDNKQFSRNYPQGNRVYSSEGIACSQTANGGGLGGATGLYKTNNYRIRKLTPKECWRLMGFTDEQFHKAEKVNSNSQLYKQAGNSIVVDVLYYLFKNLFTDSPTEKTEPESELPGQMSIMDYL